MMPARIELDFVSPRRRVPWLGLSMAVLGVAACAHTVADYRSKQVESELLSMSIARYERNRSGSSSPDVPVDVGDVSTARATLLTPWSRLLTDLESAAADSGKNVALLEIAPDKSRGRVSIAGEARSLEHVLEYLARLQEAGSIRYPLLENHEIQVSAKDRPVRFLLSADWRMAP